MLSSLLESEFFPKWGEALWIWLKSDGVNLEQVAEWYSWWKSYFPEDVTSLKGVERGFRKGLDLMNQAMALGEDVKYRYVYITAPLCTTADAPLCVQTQETRFYTETIISVFLLNYLVSETQCDCTFFRTHHHRDLLPFNRRRSLLFFESTVPLDRSNNFERTKSLPSFGERRRKGWCLMLSGGRCRVGRWKGWGRRGGTGRDRGDDQKSERWEVN